LPRHACGGSSSRTPSFATIKSLNAAQPTFVISLAGLAIDWAWILTYDDSGAVSLGLTVLTVAMALVAIASLASRLQWLR
jgi:hypothetical protein